MRLTLFLLALCLLPTVSVAQFKYGVTAGIDIGTMSDGVRDFEYGNTWYYQHHTTPPGDYALQPSAGFVGGLVVIDSMAPSLGLEAKLLYDQRGVWTRFIYTSEASPDPQGTARQTITLNYLVIPIQLNWQPVPGGSFHLFAGLTVGILLSGKSELSLKVAGQDDSPVALAQTNAPSISAIAGVGLDFDLSAKLQCQLNLSYDWGLTNNSFRESNDIHHFPDPAFSASTRDFRLMAAILLPH